MRALISRRQVLVEAACSSLGGVCSAAALSTQELPTLVFVWLRGGADALSLIVPYRNDEYYRSRPQTALLPPGRGAGSALRLTSELGLHPCLLPVLPAFAGGEASIVAGVGQAVFTASHAEAERALFASLERTWGLPIAASTTGCLNEQLTTLAARICSERPPRAALVEATGWDTHAAQGRGEHGLLASAVSELAYSVRDFRAALESACKNARIVIASEFGRSLHETALAGTDDGHASVALVFDSEPRASVLIGDMPGLSVHQLSQGRHLRPTRSLDAVLACVERGDLV